MYAGSRPGMVVAMCTVDNCIMMVWRIFSSRSFVIIEESSHGAVLARRIYLKDVDAMGSFYFPCRDATKTRIQMPFLLCLQPTR